MSYAQKTEPTSLAVWTAICLLIPLLLASFDGSEDARMPPVDVIF